MNLPALTKFGIDISRLVPHAGCRNVIYGVTVFMYKLAETGFWLMICGFVSLVGSQIFMPAHGIWIFDIVIYLLLGIAVLLIGIGVPMWLYAKYQLSR